MNQRAEDVLFAKIRQLPAERLAQIADFVDFLAAQERQLPPAEITEGEMQGGAAMNPKPQPADVPKIIVAVHGIGDQIANTTAQSVAFRVFDYSASRLRSHWVVFIGRRARLPVSYCSRARPRPIPRCLPQSASPRFIGPTSRAS
jgi:hypothetical protein